MGLQADVALLGVALTPRRHEDAGKFLWRAARRGSVPERPWNSVRETAGNGLQAVETCPPAERSKMTLEAPSSHRMERFVGSRERAWKPSVPNCFGKHGEAGRWLCPVLACEPAVTWRPDALTAALDELKLRCVLLSDDDDTRPWTRTFPDRAISLHVVLDGTCLIQTDLPVWRYQLREGELLIANGAGRGALRATSETPPPVVVSARIDLHAPAGHPMVAAFPRLVRVSPGRVPRSFGTCFETLCEEMALRKIGHGSIAARLCETLFVQALRWPCRRCWLGRPRLVPDARRPTPARPSPGSQQSGSASLQPRRRPRSIPPADTRALQGARRDPTLDVPSTSPGPPRAEPPERRRSRSRSRRAGEWVRQPTGVVPRVPAGGGDHTRGSLARRAPTPLPATDSR